MKYGMPTLIENKNIEENAQLCERLGLDFIELNMNLPEYQAYDIDVEKFNSLAKKHGISFTVHIDENLNPFDFNKHIAQAYIKTMIDTISLARNLSCAKINMHMPTGVYFTMPNKKIYLFEKYKDAFLKKVTEFKLIVENEIGHGDLKICIENGGTFEDFQLEAIDILLESTCFYLTYDIGHAACNQTFMQDFFAKRISKLAHMHCHDAQKVGDSWKNHLALGDGTLDIVGYLATASEANCDIVLETKTIDGLIASVSKLKEFNCCSFFNRQGKAITHKI